LSAHLDGRLRVVHKAQDLAHVVRPCVGARDAAVRRALGQHKGERLETQPWLKLSDELLTSLSPPAACGRERRAQVAYECADERARFARERVERPPRARGL
jgi:hypothetical protein